MEEIEVSWRVYVKLVNGDTQWETFETKAEALAMLSQVVDTVQSKKMFWVGDCLVNPEFIVNAFMKENTEERKK